jgi:hypothetical protein
MNHNTATISKDWNLNYIVLETKFTYPYAVETDGVTGDTLIKFNYRDYERLMTVIDNYPVSYLPIQQKKSKVKVAEIGRNYASSFPFMGTNFPLDFTTECRLDGLCRYFDRNESATEVHWDATGEGDFQTVTREMGYALFDAASHHMQAVFNKRKELSDLINLAADVNDPVFSNLETGWPGQEETPVEEAPAPEPEPEPIPEPENPLPPGPE